MYSILFEDDNFLIVNKRSGVLVHSTEFEDGNNLIDDISKGGKEEYFLVNRIDKFTSGIVVLTKNKQSLKLTQQLFYERKIEKQYLAIVSRELPAKNLKINLSIGRSLGNRLMFSNRNAKNYKPATTEIHEISNKFLLIKPITGRTHQIRCHLKEIGCPILNDYLYGSAIDGGEFGQFLHSYRINFMCPITGKRIDVRAPMPQEFVDMLEEMGVDYSDYV